MSKTLTDPASMREIALRMSNFDHEIDAGFEEALRAEEARVFGRHAGWEFNGRVWFEAGAFHEEVRRYGSVRETLHAPTLEALMKLVNSKWGSD